MDDFITPFLISNADFYDIKIKRIIANFTP